MTKELLEDIRKAESKAEETVKQANLEAKKIVSQSVEEAFKIRERAASESEKAYIEQKEKLIMEASKEVEAILDDTMTKTKEMISNADNKVDEAVRLVVERMLDIDGYN